MKNCVIFACTIISEQRIFVLHKFLQTFKDKFKDHDIFIGINSVSLNYIEDIIQTYNLNIVSMERCNTELYSESDASAYQVALKNVLRSGNTYENYWFVHTKSGVNEHSNYLREWYINNFLTHCNDIETFINSNSGIGSYGMLGVEFNEFRDYGDTDCEIDLMKNTLTSSLPCTHSNFFYIHTIYVINHKPMKIFFDLITNKWFETKLDRYYFEGIFPFIVSRSGYYPYLENRYSCSDIDLHPYISRWVETNDLKIYKDYINSFKTEFTFKQEIPPYVISNS